MNKMNEIVCLQTKCFNVNVSTLFDYILKILLMRRYFSGGIFPCERDTFSDPSCRKSQLIKWRCFHR